MLALSALMAVAGGVLCLYSLRWGAPQAPLTLPWWAFAVAALVNNVFVFHLEIRDEAHSFSLSEIPLVVGLFFAPPWAVVLGRLVGEAVFLIGRRRQNATKLVFNLCLFLVESSVAVVVFRRLSTAQAPMNRTDWGWALIAILLADLVSMVAVSLAIRWHGGQPRLATVAEAGAATAVGNTSLALLAVIILRVDPFALLLLAVVAIVTGLAYRGYANLRQRYASLQVLYDFTKVVGASMQAETVMDVVLREARRLLRAHIAQLVLFDRDSGQPILGQRSTDAGTGPAEVSRVADVWRRGLPEWTRSARPPLRSLSHSHAASHRAPGARCDHRSSSLRGQRDRLHHGGRPSG